MTVRKGQSPGMLEQGAYMARFNDLFYDPVFAEDAALVQHLAWTANASEYAYEKLRHPSAPTTLGDLLRHCRINHMDFTHWTETPEALADRLLQLI